jgi:LysM repeat protein
VKNSNPFNAPGSPIAKLQPRSDAKPKLIMLAVVAATVLLFSGLFIQGCQRQPATNAADADTSGGTVPSGNATGVAEPSAATPTNVASATPPDAAAASSAIPTNPFATDTAAPAPPPGPTKDYTVAKGDSFYKIAKANHITMAALTAANPGVDSAKLKPGQTLHLPVAADAASAPSAPATVAGAGSVPPDSAPAPAPAATSSSKSKTSGAKASSGGTKYVVKKGDTLGKIAKAHGTTVKAIKLANGLSSDQISVGKTIKLPGKGAATSA